MLESNLHVPVEALTLWTKALILTNVVYVYVYKFAYVIYIII